MHRQVLVPDVALSLDGATSITVTPHSWCHQPQLSYSCVWASAASPNQDAVTSCRHFGSPPFGLWSSPLWSCVKLSIPPLRPPPPLCGTAIPSSFFSTHLSSLGYIHISDSSWEVCHSAKCWEDHRGALNEGAISKLHTPRQGCQIKGNYKNP